MPASSLPPQLGNRGMQALIDRLRAPGNGPSADADAERTADAAAAEVTTTSARPRGPRRAELPSFAVPHDAPDHVRAVASAPGERLSSGLVAKMNEAFDVDFSGVAVHRDPAAARSAALLGAQAYTFGRHVAFGEGRFAAHSDAGQRLIAHELAHVVQQREGAPRLQLKKADPPVTYLQVDAADFDEAARNFAAMIALKPRITKARIVVVNGPNVKVYDKDGNPVVKKFFHLTSPTFLPTGVFGRAPNGRALHAVGVHPTGGWFDAGNVVVTGTIDFGKNIDDQEGFDKALKDGGATFFVSPTTTATPEVADAPPVAIENIPEFMQFEAKNKANLPPWPSATLPLTPQIATVNSTGTFVCRVDKNQGSTMLDRVTNLMQPTSFKWEVLKLDPKLHVVDKKRTTGWDAAVEGFARRQRQLADDRRAMLGNTRRQSIPETVFRAAMVAQTAAARETLAIVGQAVMTVINAITGGPNQLSTEDAQDVPFKEQGDYFVRCLATQIVPKDAKWRRATSVSGVMVSVYDIEDLAKDSLESSDDLTQQAEENEQQVQKDLAQLDEDIRNDVGDVVIKKAERGFTALKLDYFKDLAAAGGDPWKQKLAEQSLVRAQLAFFDSDAYPADAKYAEFKATQVKQLQSRAKTIDAEVARMGGALASWDEKIEPVGYMRAVLVDEVTSASTNLSFAVGERRYIAADTLEVVIADVTAAKGRTFTGSGSGALGAGREDAWLDAMTDLRQNLNRGRGWISYDVPPTYQAWKSELPNPMKLEMSATAQIKETIDDTAHALTVVAILAAPFTEGASLAILGVIAPIQAGSSLYNLVDRSMYGDLELDEAAVFDLINIATLGLGKLSTVGKAGSKGLEIIASSSRIALKVINGGQFLVVSYDTFQMLMEEGDENDDPRELRRRKLLKLLNWCEQASIPVSEKLFGEAHGTTGREPGKTAQGKDATLYFDEPPIEVTPGKRRAAGKTHVHEGTAVDVPAEKPVEGAAAQPAAATPTDAVAPPTISRPSRAQLRGVPESLRDKVAVVEGLGKDAKIVYKRGSDGLITDVQIQIGEKATAADVKNHAAVAELMLKYSGVGGRIRRLLDRFVNLFTGPESRRPEVGSRAWEAKYEVIKLDQAMLDRHKELAAMVGLPPAERDTARMRELAIELDALEQQYIEHAQILMAIDMGTAEGRGYVAAEGLSQGETQRKAKGYPEAPDGYRWRWRKGNLELVADPGLKKMIYDEARRTFVEDPGRGPAERFEAGTSQRQAFRELGGYDETTAFGAFVRVLYEQGLITSHEDVIRRMGDPSNRTLDSVRGKVKDAFRDKLVAQLTSTAYLWKTARFREVVRATGDRAQARRAAAMDELSRISARLDPADRGSLGERVYGELFGARAGLTHVDVTPEELAAAKGVEVEDVQARSIDRMDGGTAREIKNVTTRLGPREQGQIDDMLDLVDRKVHPRTGPPRTVTKVAVTFLDPVGGAANATLAYKFLMDHEGEPLAFEFHTRDGKVITVTSKNMDMLQQPDFRTKLGLSASQ
jgi:hypothetical protein